MAQGKAGARKRPSTIALTDEAYALVDALAERHGVSRTAIHEMAIREKAQRDKVEVDLKRAGPSRAKPGQGEDQKRESKE